MTSWSWRDTDAASPHSIEIPYGRPNCFWLAFKPQSSSCNAAINFSFGYKVHQNERNFFAEGAVANRIFEDDPMQLSSTDTSSVALPPESRSRFDCHSRGSGLLHICGTCLHRVSAWLRISSSGDQKWRRTGTHVCSHRIISLKLCRSSSPRRRAPSQ